MAVRLFHPMAANFIQQVARSLHEAGQLDRYCTSIRAHPGSRGQRALCTAARWAGFDLERDLARRAITELPLELVESRPWGEAVRVAVARLLRGDGRAHDWVWERAEQAFDCAVARRLHPGLSGVYGYEFSSLATFTRARALGLPVAYDLTSLEPGFVQHLLEVEAARFPELNTPFLRWVAAREPDRLRRRRAEFQAASVVLANSQLTRDSYAAAGLDTSRVRVLHCGSPPCADRDVALSGGGPPQSPLALVWAGTFSVRKGAHYLLDAWRQHRLGRHARLQIFGSVALPDRVMHPLPEGVEIFGSVPRQELLARLGRADALLFPTLCDGFGLVVAEAWSRGVPVITTRRAGAADLLRAQENGLLIEAANPAAIAAGVEWCLAHRPELRAMREAALATAAGWQWSDYRRQHAAVLRAAGLFSPAP